MLESLFIVMLIITVILQLYTLEKKAWVFALITLVFWMLLFASSLWIEVPYVVSYINGTGDVSILEDSHSYHEFGMSAISLGFALINIILAIVYKMKITDRDERGLS